MGLPYGLEGTTQSENISEQFEHTETEIQPHTEPVTDTAAENHKLEVENDSSNKPVAETECVHLNRTVFIEPIQPTCDFNETQNRKTVKNVCVQSEKSKELVHLNRLVNSSESCIDSLLNQERYLIYDRNNPSKNTRRFQILVPFYDIPSRITKPEQSQSYTRFLISRVNRFDENLECFTFDRCDETILVSPGAVTRRNSYIKSDLQILLNIYQPDIKYGNVGFNFKTNLEENLLKLKVIFEKVHTLNENWQVYGIIKLDSLQVLNLASKGKLGKARAVLDQLEKAVSFLELCEWTAWFYIARFYYMLKFLRKKSTFEFHKQALFLDLTRAREAFNSEGLDLFALERSLLLWWMFLSQADLIDIAADSNSSVPRPVKSPHLESAQILLHSFEKEKSKLSGFPSADKWLARMGKTQTREDHRDNEEPTLKEKYIVRDEENGSELSAVEVTTEEEDIASDIVLEDRLDVLMELVEERCNGRWPSCVQEISIRYDLGKIAVYTTDKHSKQLKWFMDKIGLTEKERYIEETDENVVFAGIPRIEIQPGSWLVHATRQQWEKLLENATPEDKAERKYTYKHSIRDAKEIIGTIGFAVSVNNKNAATRRNKDGATGRNKDGDTGQNIDGATGKNKDGATGRNENGDRIYIATAGHGLGLGPQPNGEDSVILSVREKENGNCNDGIYVAHETSFKFSGFYGTKKIGKRRFIVDSLLVNVPDEFLNNRCVDLCFRSQPDRNSGCKDQPIKIEIFEGDITDIAHLPVYMIDFENPKGVAEGLIVNHNVGPVKLSIVDMDKRSAVIMPQLEEKNKHNANDVNSASAHSASAHSASAHSASAHSAETVKLTPQKPNPETEVKEKGEFDTSGDDWSTPGWGCFAVALKIGHEEKNFARPGLSGNLVYCIDPKTGSYKAIGLVWGSPGIRHAARYKHVTYVLPLRLFLLAHPDMQLNFYMPVKLPHSDSGYGSHSAAMSNMDTQPSPSNSPTGFGSISAPTDVTMTATSSSVGMTKSTPTVTKVSSESANECESAWDRSEMSESEKISFDLKSVKDECADSDSDEGIYKNKERGTSLFSTEQPK